MFSAFSVILARLLRLLWFTAELLTAARLPLDAVNDVKTKLLVECLVVWGLFFLFEHASSFTSARDFRLDAPI